MFMPILQMGRDQYIELCNIIKFPICYKTLQGATVIIYNDLDYQNEDYEKIKDLIEVEQ